MFFADITTFDTIGLLVLGIVPPALMLSIAIPMDRVGGPAKLYAPLFVLALAAMCFFAGMFEQFTSRLVWVLYVTFYGCTLLYFCVMKSFAKEGGARH